MAAWKALRLAVLCAAAQQVTTGQPLAQVVLTPNTLGPEVGVPAAAARIDAVGWLAGHWTGEGFGGSIQETWGTPRAGRMMGSFGLFRGDSAVFHEFELIVERQSTLVLRVKHFSADLVGWEDKDASQDFPLLRMDEQGAWFEGVTFRRRGDDRMEVFVATRAQDGHTEERIVLRRQPTGSEPPTDRGRSRHDVQPAAACEVLPTAVLGNLPDVPREFPALSWR